MTPPPSSSASAVPPSALEAPSSRIQYSATNVLTPKRDRASGRPRPRSAARTCRGRSTPSPCRAPAARGGQPARVAEQHEAHQQAGRDEERGRAQAPGVEHRRGQRRAEEEPDATRRRRSSSSRWRSGRPRRARRGPRAGGTSRPRGRRAAAAATRRRSCARRRRARTRSPPARARAATARASACGPRSSPIKQLRDRAADRRRQRQPGGGGVAEVPLQHEVRHRGGHEALVEVVDGVRGRPDAHARANWRSLAAPRAATAASRYPRARVATSVSCR